MRTTFTVVEVRDLLNLMSHAQNLLQLLHTGEAFADDEVAKAKATRTANALQAAINALLPAVPDGQVSPFLRYREVILCRNTMAQTLCDLVMNMHEGHKVSLGILFSNADVRHTAIALDLITSYTRHGWADPHFVNLAAEIFDLREADKAREAEAA